MKASLLNVITNTKLKLDLYDLVNMYFKVVL
jgi:hypothetical protein